MGAFENVKANVALIIVEIVAKDYEEVWQRDEVSQREREVQQRDEKVSRRDEEQKAERVATGERMANRTASEKVER